MRVGTDAGAERGEHVGGGRGVGGCGRRDGGGLIGQFGEVVGRGLGRGGAVEGDVVVLARAGVAGGVGFG